MSNDVVLGGALRTNLLSLQRTQDNIDRVQNILATGLKVGSALDNPQNFFAAQSLNNRASDLNRLMDGIGQSISTVQAADSGSRALNKLIDQADSIAQSALEEASSGTREAVITGNVDLRGISNLTSNANIDNADTLSISYVGDNGATITETVAIADNDSIEQLITKINDLGSDAQGPGAGQLVEASLTNEGFLQIRSKTGDSFTVAFNGDGGAAGFGAADRAFGDELGFAGIAQRTGTDGAAGDGTYEVTALNTTQLTSGLFYDSAEAKFADASDTLASVVTTSLGSQVRFDQGSAGETTVLRFQVNGTTNIDVNFTAATTIQGLVDGINNNANNEDLIRASYDSNTGQFSIEAIGEDVATIGVEARDTGDNAEIIVDFGFGVKTGAAATTDDGLRIASAATDGQAGETYVLASSAGQLSQLEKDYDVVLDQINKLVEDSGYRGVNLLQGDTLTTDFNEDRSNSLETVGVNLDTESLGLGQADFSTMSKIDSIRNDILGAQGTVRQFGTSIANSLAIISTREEFTEDLVNTLEEGADKLTVADQNEEGAKLLALQTRQQLGVTSLSLAVQSQQSVLRLF